MEGASERKLIPREASGLPGVTEWVNSPGRMGVSLLALKHNKDVGTTHKFSEHLWSSCCVLSTRFGVDQTK